LSDKFFPAAVNLFTIDEMQTRTKHDTSNFGAVQTATAFLNVVLTFFIIIFLNAMAGALPFN